MKNRPSHPHQASATVRDTLDIIRSLAAFLLPLAVLVAGCSGSGPAAAASSTFESHDSAGVEIVVSGPADRGEPEGWTVVPEPVLQIGEVEGDSPYLFQQIFSAVRIPDGSIVISDGRAMDVRVFGRDGTHQVSFGGRGEGPKEFGGGAALAVLPPDTLVVWDSGNFRLSHYDLAGTLLSQTSLAAAVGALSLDLGARSEWSVAKDGALLWTGPPLGGVFKGERKITLIEGDGTVHDLGEFPSIRSVKGSAISFFPDWFSPMSCGALGTGPSPVAISAPEAWEVRLFDSQGRLSRILRAPIPRIPVTSEVRDARRSALEEMAAGMHQPEGVGSRVDDQLPVPDSLPAIGDLFWDGVGNLWVGRRAVDPYGTEVYDVFDADGRWMTAVTFPRSLGSIKSVGEDYILASWSDDLGVLYLRSYRVKKWSQGP